MITPARHLYWDVPSLPLSDEVRRQAFEKARTHSEQTGFVREAERGVLLAWHDPETTRVLGTNAFRAWWCSGSALPADLTDMACARFAHIEAGFVALSSWQPIPPSNEWCDVGMSVHAWVHDEKRIIARSLGTEIIPFHSMPERWVEMIGAHIAGAQWQDRHSRDKRFAASGGREERIAWIRKAFQVKEGFVVVRERGGKLAAYLIVPIDRTRQSYDGPAIAGLGGLGGTMEEGRWHYSALLRTAYRRIVELDCLCMVQYQPENTAVALLLSRGFGITLSTRHDVHWPVESA
jgi:hypothetical protein